MKIELLKGAGQLNVNRMFNSKSNIKMKNKKRKEKKK